MHGPICRKRRLCRRRPWPGHGRPAQGKQKALRARVQNENETEKGDPKFAPRPRLARHHRDSGGRGIRLEVRDSRRLPVRAIADADRRSTSPAATATISCGDTFYPSWASDGNLYSPWTDGHTDGVRCSSGGNLANGFRTGHAVMTGDDPLEAGHQEHLAAQARAGGALPGKIPVRLAGPRRHLVLRHLLPRPVGKLRPSRIQVELAEPRADAGIPDLAGPGQDLAALRRLSPVKPLFPEPAEFLGPVKMGAPHFVDFGKNMEHSPDGKAYLLGMGAEIDDPKPRPCIKPGPKGTALRDQ